MKSANIICLKDCHVQSFRSSTSEGVIVTHKPSGALGIARGGFLDSNTKRQAWRDMLTSEEFKLWADQEHAGLELDIDRAVNEGMQDAVIRMR